MMRLAQTETLAQASSLETGCTLVTARVTVCGEDKLSVTVDIAGRTCDALVATSCLIRPVEGDLVLVLDGGESLFILNVLERTGPNYATLALPGHGNLAIEGETLSLTARQRLAIKADAFDLRARSLAFIADKATWLGKALTTIVERWQSSARSHEVSADILTTKAVNRIAIVDQVDSLRTQTQSVTIAGIASESAQSKVMTVVDDLRMDGKRITMG